MRRALATALTAGTLGLSVLLAPAAVAQPVITGGLVNITVFDVLNNTDVNVQVPIGVAANVCGVNAAVLADLAATGPVDCTAATTQDLPARFRR